MTIASSLSQNLLKRVGVGAAIGAAGGALVTGKDGSVSENILKGAIGGGLAGGAFHGLKDKALMSSLRGVAQDANILKPNKVNILGKDSGDMLSRMADSSARINTGNKQRAVSEMHSAISDMRARLGTDASDHAKRLHAKLSDIEELTNQARRSGFGRGLQKTVSLGGLFHKPSGQLKAFDSNLSASLNQHLSEIQAMYA